MAPLTADAEARQLSEMLAPSLPRVMALHEPPDAEWEKVLPLRNQVVTFAVLQELRRLAHDEMSLPIANGHALADVPVVVDPQQLQDQLEAALAKPLCPARDVLWALLTQAGTPAAELGMVTDDSDPTKDGQRGRVSRWLRNPWLARQAVAVVLNAIIAVILVFAVWNVPGEQLGPFRIFSIWALCFLPGWMFVRFLGQRAASLWWEFVLTLHRLGADRPQYLPEPPLDSEYHDRWLVAGGAPLARAGTIYQEKFDAYYGKSVSRIGAERNPSVRAETLFPVFLTTAVLTVAWTAVLWDTGFAADPSGQYDYLKFGFLGAYSFIIQMLMRRYFQSDLKASAYAASTLRIAVVAILVTVLHQLPVLQENPQGEAVVAFIVGFFPLVGMQALQKLAATLLRTVVPSLSPSYPLNQIDGLNVWYEARLLEEGIEDMQNLATANLVDVILHTHVPVGRLIDWVDQAQLYQHLDRTERGYSERRRARKSGAEKSGAIVNPYPRRGAEDADRTQEAALHEADTGYRQGSMMRHALRTLGIRTATDLLKVYPPGSSGSVTGGPLDDLELRSLVTVLDKEPNLNLVWNWQGGAALQQAGHDLRPADSSGSPGAADK